jgi:predicted enzyme related to lactoylglutathione lyase
MAAPTGRGRFVWHELMTSNPDAAAAFYGKVIGWKTQAWPQDPSYRTWMAGAVPVGGLMALPDQAKLAGSPPHWMTYIGVPDVDAAVRQAKGLGAQTHVAPRDIPGSGRFAVLQDPQGAIFAVFTPPPGDSVPPADMYGFSWHELATTDFQAAWKFYRALFGWEHTSSVDMGPIGTYFMFGFGDGIPVGGIFNKPLEVPMPNWLPYIHVPLADDIGKAASRAGGRVIVEPLEVPGGDRVVVFLDPQGATIAAHSLPGAKPVKKTAKKTKAKKKGVKKPVKKKPVKKKPVRKKKSSKRKRR